MRYTKIFAFVGLVAALALVGPSAALAQGRTRARAAAREPVRTVRPPAVRVVRAPSYRVYRPQVNQRFFYGSPNYYGTYRGGTAYVNSPYGYGYSGYSRLPYGGVRIDMPQRDAEVLVDGYFVGTVNDFDGIFQQANLEAGPHVIEVSAPGFETARFEVYVQPGRTITYRASLRPFGR